MSIDEVTMLREANEALGAALLAALSIIDGIDADADSRQLVIVRWRTQHRSVLECLIENDET